MKHSANLKLVVVPLAFFIAATVSHAVEPSAKTLLGGAIAEHGPWDRPDGGSDVLGAADTICFGGHDGAGYAVEGGLWDFEDGTLQGWSGFPGDPPSPWWGRVGAPDFECPGAAPMILDTQGMLWIGEQQTYADAECWVCDAGESCSLGYENDLSQLAESPGLAYASGDVEVGFKYFADSEGAPYDFTSVQIVALGGGEEIGTVTVGEIGGQMGDPDNPISFVRTAPAGEIPGGTDEIRVRFHFTSDGGWSDEDAGGATCSTYGPMGIDDVSVLIDDVSVAQYDFDGGDEGWTFESLNAQPEGFLGVNELSDYGLDLPPECGLDGFVLEFHDDDFKHPGGQYDVGVSPIIDRSTVPFPAYDTIVARLDMYGGTEPDFLWRPGWIYYPWTCEESGAVAWSPRVGQEVWYYGTGGCAQTGNVATDEGVPPDAERYRFVLEILYGDCGILNECDDPAPLFDNAQVCFIGEGASGAPEEGGPGAAHLLENRPNPFTPRTEIRFSLEAAGHITLSVYDVSGRLVKRLVDGRRDAGPHNVVWDGTDMTGAAVATGIYWSELRAGERVERRKMVFIR